MIAENLSPTVRNYDLHPVIQASRNDHDCHAGWTEILDCLHSHIPRKGRHVTVIETYPGVFVDNLIETFHDAFPDAYILHAEAAYKASTTLQHQFDSTLTPDPVFGVMSSWSIVDYFDLDQLRRLKDEIEGSEAHTIVIGTGALHMAPSPDLLLHAGVNRWELQRRQRARTVGMLGVDGFEQSPAILYKNAYFLDWRVADAIRHEYYGQIDFFLDLNDQQDPRMVEGKLLRAAVAAAAHRPFRVVPFFDPGPWGGQWMRERFNLPDGPPNYAWCFDCVPEENSVTFRFGAREFALPAIVLVHEQPMELLGRTVVERFGAEFPIRFDLLDTMGGGNLSLQVHPLREYIREHFGMSYTQDESYYILDSGSESEVYLGLKTGIDRGEMRRDLESAQAGGELFDAMRYVNAWPTHKHDHFSIPAGTVHCSGSNNLVLEISATPYIFTFKLWDWGRLGLDGKPRPIHLEHGLANIQWNRDTQWVDRELLHQVTNVAEGDGWREERTGLHSLSFLETRRTWFTGPVIHDTGGNLHVLNLVEGDAVRVESPTGAFAPLEIHYAETFIVPAAVGEYMIRPLKRPERPMATIKAYVRPSKD